jgi:hypothetical protein
MTRFRRMGVDPTGLQFGMEKLNRELDRHQFIRELTQNGIEAVEATGEGGEVVWANYPMPTAGGEFVDKLACVDNGIGMTGDELVDYMNNAFRSGKERGHQANFGIGAKVSATAFNKLGVLYLSWKAGEGAMIHLTRDDEGFFSLRQLQRPDGSFGWWAPIGNERKPGSVVKDHGTVVVLLGDEESDDTFQRPVGSELPRSAWVATYLSQKYVGFPDGVGVRAAEQRKIADRPGWTYNRVRGQSYLLERDSVDRGTVDAVGARIHWWILREKSETRTALGSSTTHAQAHVAARYGNELYEARYGQRGGYQRLSSFGVKVGHGRVVIHVEPDPAGTEANLTRQALLVNGAPLRWELYAAAFVENMPEPLRKMMDEIIDRTDSRSNRDQLVARLKEIEAMLKKTIRYATDDDGSVNAEVPAPGGVPAEGKPQPEDNPPGGPTGGITGHIERLLRSPTGDRARPKKKKAAVPDFVWLSKAEGSRTPGYLEDRAAVYEAGTNTVYVNKDFRTFKTVKKAIQKSIPNISNAGETIAMLEFETVLAETVMNLIQMEDTEYWTAQEVEAQFSPEAMTMALFHNFHIIHAAQEEAKKKITRAKKLEVA